MSDFDFFDDCLFNPLNLADLKAKIEIGLKDTQVSKKREAMMAKFSWKQASEEFKKAIS
jgi:hypothetical protein